MGADSTDRPQRSLNSKSGSLLFIISNVITHITDNVLPATAAVCPLVSCKLWRMQRVTWQETRYKLLYRSIL